MAAIECGVDVVELVLGMLNGWENGENDPVFFFNFYSE